jgi:hypothetical protein
LILAENRPFLISQQLVRGPFDERYASPASYGANAYPPVAFSPSLGVRIRVLNGHRNNARIGLISSPLNF